MDYKNKYLKYKIKYLNLKKIFGGMESGLPDPHDPPNFTNTVSKSDTVLKPSANKPPEALEKLYSELGRRTDEIHERRTTKRHKKDKESYETYKRNPGLRKEDDKYTEDTSTIYHRIAESHSKLQEHSSVGDIFNKMNWIPPAEVKEAEVKKAEVKKTEVKKAEKPKRPTVDRLVL